MPWCRPGAKIAFIDLGDAYGDSKALTLPPDKELLKTGRPHAKIHSASWGGPDNSYSTQARNIDQFMFDNDEFCEYPYNHLTSSWPDPKSFYFISMKLQ